MLLTNSQIVNTLRLYKKTQEDVNEYLSDKAHVYYPYEKIDKSDKPLSKEMRLCCLKGGYKALIPSCLECFNSAECTAVKPENDCKIGFNVFIPSCIFPYQYRHDLPHVNELPIEGFRWFKEGYYEVDKIGVYNFEGMDGTDRVSFPHLYLKHPGYGAGSNNDGDAEYEFKKISNTGHIRHFFKNYYMNVEAIWPKLNEFNKRRTSGCYEYYMGYNFELICMYATFLRTDFNNDIPLFTKIVQHKIDTQYSELRNSYKEGRLNKEYLLTAESLYETVYLIEQYIGFLLECEGSKKPIRINGTVHEKATKAYPVIDEYLTGIFEKFNGTIKGLISQLLDSRRTCTPTDVADYFEAHNECPIRLYR